MRRKPNTLRNTQNCLGIILELKKKIVKYIKYIAYIDKLFVIFNINHLYSTIIKTKINEYQNI